MNLNLLLTNKRIKLSIKCTYNIVCNINDIKTVSILLTKIPCTSIKVLRIFRKF